MSMSPTNFQLRTWYLRYFRSSLGPKRASNCTLRTSPPSTRGLPRLCRCIQTCRLVDRWDVFCFEISTDCCCPDHLSTTPMHTHTQRSESGNSRIAQHRERLLTTGRSADKFESNIQMCSGGSAAPKFLWHQGSVSQSDMIRFVSGQDPWL